MSVSSPKFLGASLDDAEEGLDEAFEPREFLEMRPATVLRVCFGCGDSVLSLGSIGIPGGGGGETGGSEGIDNDDGCSDCEGGGGGEGSSRAAG